MRAMRCFCRLQKSCCAKNRMVPESISDADGLAVKLADNVVVALLLSVSSIVDTRFSKQIGLLAGSWAEAASMMANLSSLEDARV